MNKVLVTSLIAWSALYFGPSDLSGSDLETIQDLSVTASRPIIRVQGPIDELRSWDVSETISGWSFRAIQAAIPELKRAKLNVGDYHITVRRLGPSLYVQFGNPEDVSPRARHKGCAGPRPCLAVQLAPDDLRVIGSSFQK